MLFMQVEPPVQGQSPGHVVHPSPASHLPLPQHELIGVLMHAALQLLGFWQTSVVHEFPSLHWPLVVHAGVTQVPEQHFCPGQSLSDLHPVCATMQAPFWHVPPGQLTPLRRVWTGCGLQGSAVLHVSLVHGLPSSRFMHAGVTHALLQQLPVLHLQSAGQLLQFSPLSHNSFPQLAEQSLSLAELHPEGQQPSLFMHWVMGVWTHWALHVPGLEHTSVVHGSVSAHWELLLHAGVLHILPQQL